MRGRETSRSATKTTQDNSDIVHREEEKVLKFCTDFYAKLYSVPHNIIPVNTQTNDNIQAPTYIIAPLIHYILIIEF
ncbi:unnamed protein product [Arctia plantaginis]|uniref:Uncharacterized protein n=1 Tax=Arctia plantaginis TaxID=874455 RepID=A0A8S0Z8Z3_ARCPL|nr:unnamed protein product [Arctia plantaginis]